jgi:dipeptidase E
MHSRHVLLISNSTMFGRGYLDHAAEQIKDLLGSRARILFVPFAMYDRAAYTARTRARLGELGYEVADLEELSSATRTHADAIDAIDAIFVGGGNTFRLLKALYDFNLLSPIRELVSAGRPYIGSSAGSIVAGPTIKTTKDMPIVQPPSFDALGLVNFQISPHYLDPDPRSTHMGETQEERINQFLEENRAPVVGLREGGMLRVDDGSILLKGTSAARLFGRGRSPVELPPGTQLAAELELRR